MFFKHKVLVKWEIVSRILQIVEVIAIVIASFVVFQIPSQINEWNLSQGNRSTDLLLRLEDRLREGNNRKVISAIENYKPILLENKGVLTKQDLDYYIGDLMSIRDTYEKGLIDCDSAYEWFSNYFDETLENVEVKKYIVDMRKNDENIFRGIEVFRETINNCDQLTVK